MMIALSCCVYIFHPSSGIPRSHSGELTGPMRPQFFSTRCALRASAARGRRLISYQHIIESTPKKGVVQLTLNRPKALNALSTPLFDELNHALAKHDKDGSIGAIVLSGSEKAFAAGADIKEMKDKTFEQVYGEDFIESWSRISQVKKPIIAAVNGFALGGGCELAMLADIIYAGEKAVFGQPEIKLGVIPGSGGTQRLTRAIGKARAMELILTGRNFSAQEAERWGLVARVFPVDQVLPEAVNTAAEIAAFARLAVKAAKECVNEAYESSLAEGVKYERRVFHALFSTHDQKEGMSAFAEKRNPKFAHSE